jgi:hypothetical protein
MECKLVHNLSDGIPFYLVPNPNNGATISSWIGSTYDSTDVVSFCEISTAEMMTVREMTFSKFQALGNSAIFHHALGC